MFQTIFEEVDKMTRCQRELGLMQTTTEYAECAGNIGSDRILNVTSGKWIVWLRPKMRNFRRRPYHHLNVTSSLHS